MARDQMKARILRSICVFIVGVFGMLAWVLSAPQWYVAPEAAEPRLFEVGVVYDFVWDCSKMIVNTPQGPAAQIIGCWEEHLIVEHTRKDGWLAVRDKFGKQWIVNPSRAMAIGSVKETAPGPQPRALPEPTPPPASLRVQKIPSS